MQRGAHQTYETASHVQEKSVLLDRKRSLCVAEIKACVPDALEAEGAAVVDDCGACRAVATDLACVARRAGPPRRPRRPAPVAI